MAGEPVFQEIPAISLRDRVIAAVKDAFFSGAIRPGDPIVERTLARQMKVGTPTVREALIALQEQGFLRRVANTGTYVTKFTAEEVRDLFALRIEMELLAFQWAKARVTETDLAALEAILARLVAAGESSDRRKFWEIDFEFHYACWRLSGNKFLAENLERILMPLSTFVVLASNAPLTTAMAKEHYLFTSALRDLNEPEFSIQIRKCLTAIGFRWISTMAWTYESR